MKYRVVQTAIFQKLLKNLLINLSEKYSKKVALEYSAFLRSQLRTLKEFPYLWPLKIALKHSRTIML